MMFDERNRLWILDGMVQRNTKVGGFGYMVKYRQMEVAGERLQGARAWFLIRLGIEGEMVYTNH